MYTLHVISLEFTGNPRKFYRDIPTNYVITWFPHSWYMISLHIMYNKFPSSITLEIRVWRFQNYRNCGYTCNPHNIYVHIIVFKRGFCDTGIPHNFYGGNICSVKDCQDHYDYETKSAICNFGLEIGTNR